MPYTLPLLLLLPLMLLAPAPALLGPNMPVRGCYIAMVRVVTREAQVSINKRPHHPPHAPEAPKTPLPRTERSSPR